MGILEFGDLRIWGIWNSWNFGIFSPQEFTTTGNYKDFPHSSNGFPSEYSRMTGISFRINFPIDEKKVKYRKNSI